MPAKKNQVPLEVLQLKVTLIGTKPPIWRRVLVPADLTFAQFHDVLQAAMGWQNSHLHDFRVGERRFGERDPDEGFMGGPKTEDERRVRVSSVLGAVRAKAVYTYDFGDTWEHEIVVEGRLPADAGTDYPVCTGGALACPPEDCGGVWGFYELVEALEDPEHERHEEMIDWIGDYNPNAFSIEEVNQVLAQLRPRRKKKQD